MNYYCAVEVEHVRYARFLPLDQARRRTMELTTLADNQRRAEVNLYLMRGEERIFLHTFTLDPLPQKPAGAPRIVLHGDFDGTHTLRVNIEVDRKRYGGTEISLRRYLPRSRRPYLLLLLIPAAAVLLGAFLLARSCIFPAVPGDPADETVRTEEQAEPYTGESNDDGQEPAGDTTEEKAYAEEDDAPTSDDAPRQEDESPADEETADEETAAADEQDTTAAEPVTAPSDQETVPSDQETAAPLQNTVYFPPDSAQLTDAVEENLRGLLPELRGVRASRVEIAGHCALYGTEQGRMDLSANRARAVYRYLQRIGWNPEGEPKLIWYGGKQPVTKDRERQHLNRRVEIRISSSADSSSAE